MQDGGLIATILRNSTLWTVTRHPQSETHWMYVIYLFPLMYDDVWHKPYALTITLPYRTLIWHPATKVTKTVCADGISAYTFFNQAFCKNYESDCAEL